MTTINRLSICSLITIWVVLVSLVLPLAAFADDGVPPAEAPVTEEPSDQVSEVEVSAGPTEAEVPPTEEPSVQEPVVEALTAAEVLEVTPEDTQLVVLDENGETLPLVTEAAAQIVASGDPIWCPEGVTTPSPGVGGCTDPGPGNVNYDPTSLQSLLNYLSANEPSAAGIIWIAASYDSSVNDPASSDFTLQGNLAFSTMSQYNLTIQGGWSGNPDTIVNHSDPSVFEGDRLRILNWDGDVTINDLVITRVNQDTGLVVTTSEDVELDNVWVEQNNGRGARIDTTSGEGDVYIHNSSFYMNYGQPGTPGTGLRVVSNGDITLEDVTAGLNYDRGAALFTPGNVIVDAGSSFYQNGREGLYIEAGGNVTLVDVEASGNSGAGISIEGDGTVLANLIDADYNGYEGMRVLSIGDVTIEDSTFLGNGFNEIVDTDHDTYIYEYGSSGLYVDTDGSVTLNEVESEDNALHGAEIYSGSLRGVIVNGGFYGGNGEVGYEYYDEECHGFDTFTCYDFYFGDGLNVHTDGLIQLTGVESEGNYGNGAMLISDVGPIVIQDSEFLANGQGVLDTGNEDFVISFVCEDYEICVALPLAGLNLEYISTALLSYGSVSFDSGNGLAAATSGDISLDQIAADWNTGDGAQLFYANNIVVNDSVFLENGFFSGYYEDESMFLPFGFEGYASAMENCLFGPCETSYAITLAAESGLEAAALTDITLNNVVAGGNALHGAALYSATLDSVFINTSLFEDNGWSGLPQIMISGDSTTGIIDSSIAFGSGAYIETSGNATVNCSEFIDNSDYGVNGENVGGTFVLNSNTFTANLVDFTGNAVVTNGPCVPAAAAAGAGARKPVSIPVTGGVGFQIDCANPEVFESLLENGDKALFELLCGYDGLLVESQLEQLPGELPEEYEFVAGMSITVMEDGGAVKPLPAGAKVTPSFETHEEGEEYAILYWNGSEWVQVDGGELNEDGFFEAEVEFTGTFVLVMK